jgi:hypothetical protein
MVAGPDNWSHIAAYTLRAYIIKHSQTAICHIGTGKGTTPRAGMDRQLWEDNLRLFEDTAAWVSCASQDAVISWPHNAPGHARTFPGPADYTAVMIKLLGHHV